MFNLREWLGKWISGVAQRSTVINVLDSNVITSDERTGVSFVAERHYARLWLSELFLRKNNIWFTERYPLVYSLVQAKYADKFQEYANVSGKNQLDITQLSLNRTISFNYPLTPLIAFRGDTIGIDCGLVSMKSQDIIKAFAGVLSDIASKVGSATAAEAIKLTASVAEGIQSLLGAGDATPKLYYHESFTATGGAQALISGYIFLSEKPTGAIKESKLWITDDGLKYGDDKDNLSELEPQDYILVQVQCVAKRDDYASFSYLKEPFDAALDAKISGNEEQGKALLGQALKNVRSSLDFTNLDRARIMTALTKAYADGINPVEPEEQEEEKTFARESAEGCADTLDRYLQNFPFDESRPEEPLLETES